MTNSTQPVQHPALPGNPIIEAVVDFDCDMPQGFDLGAVEDSASMAYQDLYPQSRKGLTIEQQFTAQVNAQPVASPMRSALHSLMFHQKDGRQIVQVRTNGYSFNRLADYIKFDDYLPEIRRTWNIFRSLVSPIVVRQIRLRYINRILLPFQDGSKINLDNYLALGPQLVDTDNLTFTGFLHQHAVLEPATGNQAAITLTTQPQPEGVPLTHLVILLDIAAHRMVALDPAAWDHLSEVLGSLRTLKNNIFERTLTPQCRQLYPSLP